ncbi:CehA/McbA family metallohydrolase [Pseudoduganella dura]|uniref:CehA/McbA family metallohydrolase n=1 Tax=Pseudoduganella dura TaxID=321982 RepID=UPI00198DE63A|nr:CehA/McbA family metallohydrolase [Pseudoduganella dura]GGY17824.1 hypothetical protein GCM10007386_54350 [Pseudoduganella dura]
MVTARAHECLSGWSALLLAAAAIVSPAAAQPGGPADHDAFSAWLEAPWRVAASPSETAGGHRFILTFNNPTAAPAQRVDWRLELFAADGRPVERWRGRVKLLDGTGRHVVAWRPRGMAPGIYRLRMTASPRGEPAAAVEEERTVRIGPAPAAPQRMRSAAAPVPETRQAWDIYLGNLHSQSGHSDGGVPVADCRGGSHPGSMPAGPAQAYAFAREHGLDFLLVSEHNHMYDGSDGSDPQADPERARQLYRGGLAQAAAFTAAHPGFVALYGLEWGVIANGGHLNILDNPELLGWERNAEGEVIGDTFTAKNDYGALYSLLGRRGWLGQFNHPGRQQFHANGQPFGHSAEGDAAMALCEVMNSAAFSNRTDEGETRMSSYERTCQRALEAGWHVAFSSNQDNHCANWGASAPNRTGVLLPRGTPLTTASLLDAIRARRVFATTDKAASVVLTANGAMMGERIVNRGTLTLAVQYRGNADRGLGELVIVSGIPGRNGTPETMTLLAGAVTIAPAPGEHYYYARVTQDDGSLLWSAPVWVTQQAVMQEGGMPGPGMGNTGAREPDPLARQSGMRHP